MVELVPQRDHERTLQISPGDFHADAYQLMAMYLASREFQNIDIEDHGDAEPPYSGTRYWGDLAQSMEVHRVPRLLLSLAITLRQQSDHAGWWIDKNTNVGVISEDVDSDNSENPLELRAACNKIIHASSLHYDIEPVEAFNHIHRTCRFLNPFLYLYGTQRAKSWKATLDVRRFAKGPML